jgi:hypothetical protein
MAIEPASTAEERELIVIYMRHLATLRGGPGAHELRVIASDVEALFHLDPQLNPQGVAAIERQRK